jgi:2-keto-4-pentenoate hydratase/2-oxohepta-3-ene-1,7-dioic acid hydratase in catechol pathway
MEGYRLLSFYGANVAPQAGILVGDRVYSLGELVLTDLAPKGAADVWRSTLDILNDWDRARDFLQAFAKQAPAASGVPLWAVKLAAPILYPGAIFVIGGNYASHAAEMAKMAGRPMTKTRVDEPFFVLKPPRHTVTGCNAVIPYPAFSKQLDWEAELGVVIGRRAETVAEKDAMDYVAGFAICNDLSARDYIRREGMPNQIIHDWFAQKCFPGSFPMGPWITPKEFVPDPYDIALKLWVNGVLKQDGNTSEMVFSIAEQIAYLSRHVVLQPGDVISTGCPAGVGIAQGEVLHPGDEIRMEFGHCGTMINVIGT